jgi:NTE family protein
MNVHVNEGRRPRDRTHLGAGRPPFECIALLLQGGGALGAYQAGVYSALVEADLHPDWVAGISIGAINAALIAGNPPEARLDNLRSFWNDVTADPGLWGGVKPLYAPRGDFAHSLINQLNASLTAVFGVRGFFSPRGLNPWLQPAGALDATSYYDTSALKTTLERLVDFDRINAGVMRFSVGAVNVTTGNFVYFDNSTHVIRPEHVMASGALPPGFPPIEIEGEYYWDGGLVSNTPLQWVMESELRQDTLAFQVDLWNARGAFPRNLAEVTTRQKEIQYSSRTRANSNSFRHRQKLRNALGKLLPQLPDDLKDTPEYRILRPEADRKVYNLIHLIYRSKSYECGSKDYEFSRQSMEEHWSSGYHDAVRALRQPEVLQRPQNAEGVLTFDFAVHGRE